MRKLSAKICIVGSGVAGCLVAKSLAKKYDDILIVERGASVTHAWRLQYHQHEQKTATAEHHHVVVGPYKEKDIQYVYALGGTTNHWMGFAPRLLPSDFR